MHFGSRGLVMLSCGRLDIGKFLHLKFCLNSSEAVCSFLFLFFFFVNPNFLEKCLMISCYAFVLFLSQRFIGRSHEKSAVAYKLKYQ